MQRTTQMTFAASVVALASLLLLAFAPLPQPATAQRADQKQLYNISINRFKPEMETEYYDFVKNVMNPLYVKGGVKARFAYRPDRGTRNEIIYFVPQESYGTIGVPPDGIGRALGNEDAVRLFWQRHSRFLEGAQIITVAALPEMSWTNPKFQGQQPQLALMRWNKIAHGRTTEYEDYFKNYEMPARRKYAEQLGMLGQWRFRLRFGGDVDSYLMLRPLPSYTELDEGTKGLGDLLGRAEAQKIFDKLPQGVIVGDEAWLIRFRPDLSIIPPGPGQNTAAK